MCAKSRSNPYVLKFVRRRKQDLIKVFHSQCCICGFDAYPEALEFHHVDPTTKQFSISTETLTRALETQLTELRKCVLVCANCHRGIHGGYIQVPENWQDFYDEDVAQSLVTILHQVKQHKIYRCIRCGAIITKQATYCPNCYHELSRLHTRPTRDELKYLIRTSSFIDIGRLYNVTDNAIRKWCKSMNLPTRKTDIQKISDADWEKI